MDALDLLDAFNVIDRVEGLLMRLWYRDAGRTFRIERNEVSSGADYEAMLRKRGVAVFGRRITSRYIIFSVKARQARWAEHILERAGAPLASGRVDASNEGASLRHGGQLPPAWADRPDNERRRQRRRR